MLTTLFPVVDAQTRNETKPTWTLDATSGATGPRVVIFCADVDRLEACRLLVTNLAGDCRVVLCDLVDATTDHESEAAAAIFTALMEESRVPLHLVALDAAAGVALEIAASNYEVVNTVTLLDSSGTTTEADFRVTGCHTLVVDAQDESAASLGGAVRQHLRHWFL